MAAEWFTGAVMRRIAAACKYKFAARRWPVGHRLALKFRGAAPALPSRFPG